MPSPAPSAPTTIPLLVSTRETARVLGLRYDHVRTLIRTGDLPARKLSANGKTWFVHRDDLDAFARGPAPTSPSAAHSP